MPNVTQNRPTISNDDMCKMRGYFECHAENFTQDIRREIRGGKLAAAMANMTMITLSEIIEGTCECESCRDMRKTLWRLLDKRIKDDAARVN